MAEPLAFNIITKPIGPICNLDCTYCFYLHKEELFPEGHPSAWRMNEEMLETYVREYIAAQEVPQVDFLWQGGEPTLLGVNFFRKAVELQQKYRPTGVKITNAFQTNGVLIDDEWCEFLAEHDFLVGFSIDGPPDCHDKFRVDKGGAPSFDKCMNGRAHLVKHGVRHNALCVVNSYNGDRPLEVYHFFKEEGFEHIQFIPAVERLDFKEKSPGTERPPAPDPTRLVTGWSVRPNQYGNFLVAIFDEWIRHDVGKIYIQIVEECVSVWLGVGANLCIFRPTCGKALAIEHNGDLFSCDHFVYEDFKLGNIAETPIKEMVAGAFQKKFGQDKSDTLPQYCLDCEVRFMCNGGCPKDRFIDTPTGDPGLNYLCAGFRKFFNHVDPYMKAIVAELRARRPATNVMNAVRESDRLRDAAEQASRRRVSSKGGRRAGPRSAPGRNEPCPCGSGKKYKKCCMAKAPKR